MHLTMTHENSSSSGISVKIHFKRVAEQEETIFVLKNSISTVVLGDILTLKSTDLFKPKRIFKVQLCES